MYLIKLTELILMDMMMPVMDGYTATKHIRASKEEYDHIPVLALTLFRHLNKSEADIRNLCNDYLRKPIAKMDLIQALAKYLKHDARKIPSVIEEGSNDDIRASLSGSFRADLKLKFYTDWMQVSELMSIDDILEFSTDLEEYSKERGLTS